MATSPDVPAVTKHPGKAYTVREDDEGFAVVVFAQTSAKARRLGASRFGLSPDEVDDCYRSPEFDGWAGVGKVPPLALIEAGWRFECSHCGHMLSSDAEGPEGEELSLVADGDRVYCHEGHLMGHWQERRLRQARVHAVIEACELRFQGWPIFGLRAYEHYLEGGRDTVPCCDFDFPGRKGLLARWDLGSSDVLLSACDVDAWHALKPSISSPSGEGSPA